VNISESEQIPKVEERQQDVYKEEKVVIPKNTREVEFQLDCGLTFKDLGKIEYFLESRKLDSRMLELTTVFYDPHFYGGATHIYRIRHRKMKYGDRIELIGFLRRTFPFIEMRRCKPAGVGLEYR